MKKQIKYLIPILILLILGVLFFYNKSQTKKNDKSISEIAELVLAKIDSATLQTSEDTTYQKVILLNDDKARLQNAIKNLSEIQKQYDLMPPLISETAIEPGDSCDLILNLRKRLILLNDLNKNTSLTSNVFDEQVKFAVTKFQERHGLQPDGVLGKNTIITLNTPIKSRIKTLQINLKRIDEKEVTKIDRYIEVNVAAMELRLIENNEVIFKEKTIVGKTSRKTPLFESTMTYLVLNPYWTIPSTILKEDVLPKIQENFDYLKEHNYRIIDSKTRTEIPYDSVVFKDGNFPYTIRQEPGEKNSLGIIKFMFANKHNVYIHDTPAKNLFNDAVRTHSSGCIRVENPTKLAEKILNSEEWEHQTILDSLAVGKPKVVSLKEPIKVKITYKTAWVEKDGTLNFRNDIYKLDGGKSAELETTIE